jgi:5-methylcytosine-specific restriction protein A
MKRYICREAGCNNLLEKPGYCNKHKKEHSKSKSIPFENATRSNADLYKTAKWRALAKKHLSTHNFCVCCGTKENLTVDHIIPPRGDSEMFFDIDNLETLCVNCHRWKTAREISERKNSH